MALFLNPTGIILIISKTTTTKEEALLNVKKGVLKGRRQKQESRTWKANNADSGYAQIARFNLFINIIYYLMTPNLIQLLLLNARWTLSLSLFWIPTRLGLRNSEPRNNTERTMSKAFSSNRQIKEIRLAHTHTRAHFLSALRTILCQCQWQMLKK